MRKKTIIHCLAIFGIFAIQSCIPSLVHKTENKSVPSSYNNTQDTNNTANVRWQGFLKDSYLTALIDTALSNNQELNIVMQEIQIAQNEVRARKGQYLPFVDVGVGAGVERASRYTRNGAVDENVVVGSGQKLPTPLSDLFLGATASWQVDIWKKLRNSKKSAVYNYLASKEGRNFMVTNLIVEISQSYYELLALDNQLINLQKNIDIQTNALETVRMEKNAARVTELAVRRFEAEIAKNKSHMYYIMQRITETENRINFLLGRFPQPVQRDAQVFHDMRPDSVKVGVPSQLLANRTDIRQSELELEAAKLDIKVAKANFYPMFNITAGLGYEAFNAKYFFSTPQSLLYTLAGSLVAPVVNRNAIKAEYSTANARQIQAAYHYERTILNAYTETANQISNINNLSKSYDWKSQQVDALTRSVNTSINLFKSARADYVEILLTQRDALESRMELIEIRKDQMNAAVKMYQVLGGGWK